VAPPRHPTTILFQSLFGFDPGSLFAARDGHLCVEAFAKLVEKGQIVALTDGDQIIAVTTTTAGAAALEVITPRPLL
jgi:hypothetical protein